MKPKPPKFQLARPRTDDLSGRIVITIRRRDGNGKIVPNNVSRSMTIHNAKVSDVADAIEVALFGQKATG